MVVSTQMRMANDIAVQFRHLPDDAAASALANHLRQFWDPRMRAQLLEVVADHDRAADLDPLVVAAAALLTQPLP